MKQNALLVVGGGLATVVLTFLVVQQPYIPLAIFIAAVVVGIFKMIRGWWRRAYVLTILAMGAGASHIGGLVQIGSLAKIGALGLLVLATILTTRHQQRVWGSKLHKFTIGSLWLTAFLALLSITWSEARVETIFQVATFLAFIYILHRTSTTRWQDRRLMVGEIGATYWVAFFLLAVGGVLALGGFPGAVSSFSGRHLGIFNNPNLLGMIAALTVALGIGWAAHKRSPLVWASLLLPVSQVIFSESRTAMIASALAIVWVILRSGLKHIVVIGYIALILTLTAIAIRWEPKGERFQRFTESQGTGLLNSRTLAWEDVLSSLTSTPLGVGWAATTDVLSAFRAGGIGSGLSSIHNSYLQLIYELGVVGIVPVALILIVLVRVILMKPSGLAAGLVAVALAGAIIQFTESAIFGVGQPYPYLFWFAVVAATIYPAASQPKPEEADLDSELRQLVSQR